MRLRKLSGLIILSLLVNLCLAQPVIRLNNNLKLTAKIFCTRSEYFIIPELKVYSDTQNIQIHKELTYGNEANILVDCRFFLKKIIKDQFVNMYVFHPYHPDMDSYELRKFATKDALNDTIKIDDFINLEPRQYVVSLELKYYLNGEEQIVYSGETGFFMSSANSLNPIRKQSDFKKQ